MKKQRINVVTSAGKKCHRVKSHYRCVGPRKKRIVVQAHAF